MKTRLRSKVLNAREYIGMLDYKCTMYLCKLYTDNRYINVICIMNSYNCAKNLILFKTRKKRFRCLKSVCDHIKSFQLTIL